MAALRSVWVYMQGIPGMDNLGNPVAEMKCQDYGFLTVADADTYDMNGVVDISVHGPEPVLWPFCEGSNQNPIPVYVTSEIGNDNDFVLKVTFNDVIKIDDDTGITVTVDASGAAISEVRTSKNVLEVHIDPVATGQVVTFAYDGTGNLRGFGGAPVDAIPEKTATNNVT